MRAQHGRVMTRAQRKAFVDHDGREIGIQDRGAEGVFEASDDDRLIDELIDRTPQLAPFGSERRPIVGGDAGDDQGFEIRTARRMLTECRRQQVGGSPLPSSFSLQSPACWRKDLVSGPA